MTRPAPRRMTPLLMAGAAIALSACSPQAEQPAKPVTLVETVTVQPQPHTQRQLLTGAVQARAQTPAAFLVSGRITSAVPAVGDRVTKGQTLATIADAEQQADIKAAEAGVMAARNRLAQVSTTLERQKTLWDQGLTTRSALDGAQTAYDTAASAADSAEAQLRLAQEALSYTKLVASADGVIIRKLAEVEEVIAAGSPVYVIAEDGARNVVVNVQETAITGWSSDHRVGVTPIAGSGGNFEGRIAEVAPALDVTGTVQVKIAIEADLPLGAPVTVELDADPVERILLPAEALDQHRGSPTVWVVGEGNTVRQAPVTVESYETSRVVISDGLEPGDTVVTAGAQFLSPGQNVEIREVSSK